MSSETEISQSFFGSNLQLPLDPISGKIEEFTQDDFPHKVNLIQSAPRDGQDSCSLLPSVREAASRFNKQDFFQGCSPILGHQGLRDAVAKSILGEHISSTRGAQVCTCKPTFRIFFGLIQLATCQANSDIGAFNLASKLIARCHSPRGKVYLPEATSSSYLQAALDAGLECEVFDHFDTSCKQVDFDSYKKMLVVAEAGSAILLYACGNDVTGTDFSEDEWAEVGRIIKERNLFPIFNAAYLGLASGFVDKDAYAIRYFIDELKVETAVCASYDHSMGLYGEGVGCLLVYTSSNSIASYCSAYLEQVQRSQISNPPRYGASIAHLLLTDSELTEKWANDLQQLVDRSRYLRRYLYDSLLDQAIPGQWNFIIRQKGLFGFLGLSRAAVKELRETYHIYMADNSRISLAALNEENAMYLAIAMADCVRNELLNDF
uniref:Aminotransferase class I/classII large domain-containing protein n=2 Tax=Bionectria ochroleuca TaxID=29856 RepID=A0A0B7JZ98_BIOOC